MQNTKDLLVIFYSLTKHVAKKRMHRIYATIRGILKCRPILIFILFLGGLTVTAEELVNTSSGIDELALTSIERVRGA